MLHANVCFCGALIFASILHSSPRAATNGNVISRPKRNEAIPNDPITQNIDYDDLQLTAADLAAEIDVAGGSREIVAYPFTTNDAIVRTNATSRFSQLRWATYGSPSLLKMRPKKLSPGASLSQSQLANFFDLSGPESFHCLASTTPYRFKDALAQAARRKYGGTIEAEQIRRIYWNSFRCKIYLFANGSETTLEGYVADTGIEPLRISFGYHAESTERALMQTRLADDRELTLKCRAVASAGAPSVLLMKNFMLSTGGTPSVGTELVAADVDRINFQIRQLQTMLAELEKRLSSEIAAVNARAHAQVAT